MQLHVYARFSTFESLRRSEEQTRFCFRVAEKNLMFVDVFQIIVLLQQRHRGTEP